VRVIERFEGRAMASPLRLTIHGCNERSRRSAWTAVVAEFQAAEQALSRFRESSDLTRLNRAAGPTAAPMAVDPRLRRALVAAHRAGRVTGGRFDARVLADLERLGYRGASIPSDEGPAVADWVEVGPDGSACLRMPVDLGGIGKGLALRWARDAVAPLIARGGALIEAGGDIAAIGRPPADDGWLVEIEDPTGSGDGPAVVAVVGGAVATSSSRIVRWNAPDGRLLHHLIDPRTGEPGGAGLLSVTVAAPDPAWAEVWSKALFLEGATGIAALARRMALAAWWIRSDGSLEMTSPARIRTIWTAAA
jgi:thiamine biosynthesis lipoprotein